MSEIRRLSAGDFDALVTIAANAYPGMKIVSAEDRDRMKQRVLKYHQEDQTFNAYGLFRNDQLLGTMYFFDFVMNFLSVPILAGGVGGVAVDLAHKKEQVAKEMIAYFLRHYRNRGAPVALLYPFRHDFYKKMGFGYGAPMNQYRVSPGALPQGPSKAYVRYLGPDDQPAVLECYNRFARATHGMIERSDMSRVIGEPIHRIVGYEKDGQVQGYIVFVFEHSDMVLVNDVHVREFVYENQAALSELLTFLHSQADQIRRIVFDTQDEFFYHVLSDPRNDSGRLIPSVYHESSTCGIGLMYRVIDVPGIFRALRERNFGGQTCALRLTIVDSFLPENAGNLLLRFDKGRLHIADAGAHDVEIRLDIAEFSSLLVGVVNFKSLYKYGLAELSDAAYVDTVNQIFAVEDKPICMTHF